jgi:osmotically-inducible protein OsmY
MIDDRDENATRSGSRLRNAGDLEGQNVRTHDQGMRVRGSGRDREDTSRYGRTDDDRGGRSGRDEEWEMRQGRPYDDDRGYSWHQDRDPSRFDEGLRGRSWEDTQRGSRGGQGDRGYGGYGDDRMHTSVDGGRGYRENRDLAGTSGRLGQDPERDYGRGGPIGGGSGYGGRQYEGSRGGGYQGGDRGQGDGNRDVGSGYRGTGYGGFPDETREMYGGQRGFVRDDRGRGHGQQGQYGQGQYGQGQYGQGQGPQGGFGQGQYGQGQYGQGQLGQGGQGPQGGFGQGQYGQEQRSARGSESGQRRVPKNYQRSDQRIYEDVCDRLSDDDELDVSNIEIKVEGGEVTVTGHVDSRSMKRRIEDVAERVPGVKDVHVQVKVQRQGQQGPQGQDQSRQGTQNAQAGAAASTGSAEKSAKPGAQGHTSSS